MFCGNCGKKLPDDAMFCPFCGAKTDLYYEQESGSDAWDGAWDGGAYAEEPAPAAPVQQPAYTYSENTYVKPESGLDSFTNNIQAKLGATDNRPVTHEYQRLGGWLALIAYGCLAGAILTPIEGVISLMGMSSLSSMFAGYLDNMIAVITLFIVRDDRYSIYWCNGARDNSGIKLYASHAGRIRFLFYTFTDGQYDRKCYFRSADICWLDNIFCEIGQSQNIFRN